MGAIGRRHLLHWGLGAAALAALPLPAWSRENSGLFLEYGDIQADGLPVQRLTIWLPPGYGKSDNHYRVLYMHDAQNLFDPAVSNFNKVWAADRAMLQHAATRNEDPWIIVGIWSPGVDRYRQYLPLPAYETAGDGLRTVIDEYAQGPIVSHRYLDWIATALKPWIDSAFRTHSEADDTAIVGSSMGGLISLYAFLEHPDTFGRAGCVSTHWPAVAPQSVGDTDPELVAIWEGMLSASLGQARGRKLWFDHGTATLDAYYPPYQAKIDTYLDGAGWRRGRDWMSRSYLGAEHEENAWARRLPEVFDWLLS